MDSDILTGMVAGRDTLGKDRVLVRGWGKAGVVLEGVAVLEMVGVLDLTAKLVMTEFDRLVADDATSGIPIKQGWDKTTSPVDTIMLGLVSDLVTFAADVLGGVLSVADLVTFAADVLGGVLLIADLVVFADVLGGVLSVAGPFFLPLLFFSGFASSFDFLSVLSGFVSSSVNLSLVIFILLPRALRVDADFEPELLVLEVEVMWAVEGVESTGASDGASVTAVEGEVLIDGCGMLVVEVSVTAGVIAPSLVAPSETVLVLTETVVGMVGGV